MLSKETENDLETLLSMEIKLRLLDAEGIDIPQDPPPIPDDPPNYDFCYDLKWIELRRLQMWGSVWIDQRPAFIVNITFLLL